MRLSVERLRWVLITGAVLLVVALGALVGYGRYRARKVWDKLGIKITHDTNGVTYSQSDGKRTIFTLHAAKAIPEGDGKYSLKDAELTLYGKAPGETDVVSGKEFEYNEKTGVATALGQVSMDLHTPSSEKAKERKNPPKGQAADGSQTVHVTTSGLVYLRKLDVAATSELVEFTWGDLQCESKGAEFHPGESTLHLLSQVHLTGQMQGHPLDVKASEATLDRTLNVVDMSRPIAVTGDRRGQADHAVAYLSNNGNLEHGQATGSVVLVSGTQTVTAARMDVSMRPNSRPETAKLAGGVTLTDTSGKRPMHAVAQTADASFDVNGAPRLVVATGSVAATMVDHSGKGPGLKREMHGDRVTATLVSKGHGTRAQLSEVHAVGSAGAHGEQMVASGKSAPQMKATDVAADDLRAEFTAGPRGNVQMQHLFGQGHTTLEQDAALGEQEKSAGDTLEMAFAPSDTGNSATSNSADAGKISSAVQSGHVVIHSRAAAKPGTPAPTMTTADGDRAVYSDAADTLTLTGNAHFDDGVNSLTAATVVMDQRSGDADAQGNVVASVKSAEKGTPASGAQPTTHVMSSSAKFTRAGKLAEFRGSDAQPARLWQGPSQVLAADLLFDGVRRTLAARPATAGALIHAVFAGVSTQTEGKESAAKPASRQAATILRVASEKMDYADLQREATFAGKVRMEGSLGDVESQRAVVLLLPEAKGSAATHAAQPNPLGGSIDRVVVYGDVHMQQPGRLGTGDQLLYTAATDSFVLTGTPGHPPHVVDAQQGNVTGATLLFQRAKQGADSTIVVAGEPPGTSVQGGRVRTETEVKRKN